MKKIANFSALLLVMVILFSACAPKADGNTTPQPSIEPTKVTVPTSPPREDITIALGAEPLGLNPPAAYDAAGAFVVQNIFDGLVESNVDGKIVPNLAESWDISPDMLEYTFHIKHGVFFQNGDALKASDVKYSLDQAVAAGNATETTDFFESISIVDDYTVKVKVTAPNILMINNFAGQYFYIVNEAVASAAGADFANNPAGAGTGPYKFVSWEPGVGIKLERNENYQRGVPIIKNVNFKFISESSSATIALETGDVDIITMPSFLDAANLQNNPKVQVVTKPGGTVYYIVMNMDKAPYDDINVRKAIAYAVNRADLVVAVANGNGAFTTNSLCMPTSFAYANDIPAFDQDLAKAQEYMSQSAYANGFETTMTVSRLENVAEILKDMLAKINITVNINALDFSAMADNYMGGEMEIGIMNSGTLTPDCGMELYDKIVSSAWINFSHYSNPEVDRLVGDSLKLTDQTQRDEMIVQAQHLISDDMPVVPMYVTNMVQAANAALKNFDFNGVTSYIQVWKLSW